jgi:hypothetical protein
MYKDREPSPLRIKDPEFECTGPHEYSMEANVQISRPESGYKYDRFSTLTFRTDNMGGYPMQVAMRLDGSGNEHWYQQDNVVEISIQFAGDYEADQLKQFFQHIGSMMMPVYGDTVKEIDDLNQQT